MTYPPQQPGNWPDPSWPGQQPYDPASGAPAQSYSFDPTSGAGGYPGSPAYPPAYQQPYQQPYPAGYPAQPNVNVYTPVIAMAPPSNGTAVASLVLSLVGLLVCGITAPIGAILGHVARNRIRQTGEGGDGMAVAGMAIGWIVTGLWAIAATLVCLLAAAPLAFLGLR